MLAAVANQLPCERRGALHPPRIRPLLAVDPVKAQLNIAHVLGFVAKEGHRLLMVGSTRKYVFGASLSVSDRQLYSLNQRPIILVCLRADLMLASAR
jgi:hypothetical protein